MSETLRNAFVCGYPVKHSRSPLIHNYWLEELGIAGSYQAIEIAPESFRAFLHGLRERNLAGGNITIPHKEAALTLLDEADHAAERIGAINTVWLEGNRLLGMNTDWQGFALNMDQQAPGWDQAGTALVLGAGGAARGILYALAERGIGRTCIVNRTLARAESLASSFQGVRASEWSALPALLPQAELLINTTSLGMHGQDPLRIDLSLAPRHAVISDIVYVPLETPLLREAREHGLRTVDGLGMLLHQAAPGFEKWFGVRPQVTEGLRAHILRDLGEMP